MSDLRLGLDTGGTYTDAVLVDDRDRIVAAHKALTTHHDLALGLQAAVHGLPAFDPARVRLVCLSTTLATNALIERRGAPVGALLPGYDEEQVRQSGIRDLLPADHVVILAGGHTALGEPRGPLDELGAEAAIRALAPRVAAFAVSGTFGVRNPEHELQLRDRVLALTAMPVTCGHELAHSLGAPRRALTTALNARIVPVIRTLIEAVRAMLAAAGIGAPVMMVKGDGSLVNLATALRTPVGTILSGPAASALGARALTGATDAVVADMGGTTTDVALLRGGEPVLGGETARVGEHRPMVEAIRVISVGLGADSEARFQGGRGLVLGPRRVVPLSLLAHTHPPVLVRLEHQWRQDPDARNLRFMIRLGAEPNQLAALTCNERRAWDALADGPLALSQVAFEDRELARALGRLERRSLVGYSGFTPSDAAHVLGLCDHWNGDAARLAARIFGRQMRHVYGLGEWAAGDAEGPSRAVLEVVLSTLAHTLVDSGLHLSGTDLDPAVSARLTELLLASVRSGQPSPVQIRLAPELPLIGVGAPAASVFPELARMTGASLDLPGHGAVANAYGAVMGRVSQRVTVTVSQPLRGVFRVYHRGAPLEFRDLDQALARAETIARDQALALAREAGGTDVTVGLVRAGNHVHHDIDGELFLDTRVTATASGPVDLEGADAFGAAVPA